ncbi:SdiA-regulated domain-containing protein [Flavimarina sp. Hel_I_48]|uniref:SdiA-regulated domain-containing protein n=1 Tax=Flavimarina sp. Hel_I_48 TaxID=1392488 RepID=UPI0004DEE7B9|nr:SdiA-regulated domain-containing protein [Flavimarina sp. Hel_I_48]
MKRLELWIIGAVLLLSAGLIFAFSSRFTAYEPPEDITYSIENMWTLPDILEEVSGISWIGNDEIAAIQDEDGIVFIYNLKADTITQQIKFSGSGDYEDITVNGTTAYVIRSDGKLYEIRNYRDKKPEVNSYDLDFLKKSNVEAMTVDVANNRLLIVPKDRDPNDDKYKGVYTFSLDTKKAKEIPLLKIDMKLKAFKDFEQKKKYKTVRPSAIAIHPFTKDYYVLEGVNPKLLIFDAKGKLKNIHLFDKRKFLQPEGITFSPEGTLYISNEANGEQPTILEVKLNVN